MPVQTLADGLHIIPGFVNIYLLETDDGLMMIDTGLPGSVAKTLKGIAALGKKPHDVRNIVITHVHTDHVGGAAALKRETGASLWAHPIDAPLIEAGINKREMKASPGTFNRLLTAFLMNRNAYTEPVKVDRHVVDGDAFPFLPDLKVIHLPGHSAGQFGLFWERAGGILFVSDACVNRRGIRLPLAHEDTDLARKSLAKLAALTFESICFMHGKAIMSGGDRAFRAAWFNR